MGGRGIADVRLSADCPRIVHIWPHSSPPGMQLVAKYRISSLEFRSTQSRHLKLVGHYSILRAGCLYPNFYKNNH